MSGSSAQRLAEIQTSLKEMREALHFWDSLSREVGRTEEAIEAIKNDPATGAETVEKFRLQREDLHRRVLQELNANIENEEDIALPVLIGTAVVGIAVPAIFFSAKILAAGGAAAGFQAVKSAVGQAASKWGWVRAKWYRRWAPVPLGMGFGAGRTAWVAREQRIGREALKKSAPASLPHDLKGIKEYPSDREFVKTAIPALYGQVKSPEGILVLTHILLETFSLSPSLGPEEKMEYGALMEEEWENSLTRFGKWILTLDMTGALASEESLFQINADQVIAGHLVRPGMGDFVDSLRREKRAVLEMAKLHEEWLQQQDVDSRFKRYALTRKEWIDRNFSLQWGNIQSKIRELPLTIGKTREALRLMGGDFRAKNQRIWDIFVGGAGDYWGSTGGMIGFFSAPLFLEGGFSLMIKAIPFMMAGSWVEASYDAGDAAALRQPIRLCLPGYGSLCEEI